MNLSERTKKAKLVRDAYQRSRYSHGIEDSKLIAADALREANPGLSLAEAREYVERWYAGKEI